MPGEELDVAVHSECESDAELITDTARSKRRWWGPCCVASCEDSCGRRYCFSQVGDGMEPKDRFHLVYICMLMAGAGFLFPWNSYITAIDYFILLYKHDFPQVTEAIPMTYLITTFLSSTFNMSTVERFPLHGRITFGYIMFSISLLFVPLLDIGIGNCTVSTHVSFYLTLLSIVVVGLGSGVQQSTYYGLAGMLPRRYPQAVMTGESVAGLVVSINRIITKAAFQSERFGAIAFFVISLLFILVCVGCHCFIRMSPFVRYHTARCQQEERQETAEQDGNSVPLESLESLPDQEQQKLVSHHSESEKDQETSSLKSKCYSAIQVRLLVIREIWQLVAAIFMAYLVTLMVFPGLISEVQYNPIGTWTPVLLVTVFNFTDLIAKWLALLPIRWSPTALMVCSILRVVLIPLILLCVSPSPAHPVLSNGVLGWAVIFTFTLGLSNGYFGSLPMINVSQQVENPRHRELAGTIMTWFLLLALTLGSVLAYALTPLTRLEGNWTTTAISSGATFLNCSHGNRTAR